MDSICPRVLLVDLSLIQLSIMTKIPDKLTPVKMRIKNHEKGSRKTECRRIEIEAREASAANTLMWPTRPKRMGMIIEPQRNPT